MNGTTHQITWPLWAAILMIASCSSAKLAPSATPREGITEAEYQKVAVGIHFTEVGKILDSKHLDDGFAVGEGIVIKGPNGEECDRVQYYRTQWGKPEERATIYYKDLRVVAKTIKVPEKGK